MAGGSGARGCGEDWDGSAAGDRGRGTAEGSEAPRGPGREMPGSAEAGGHWRLDPAGNLDRLPQGDGCRWSPDLRGGRGKALRDWVAEMGLRGGLTART